MKIETFYRVAAFYPDEVQSLLEKIATSLCMKAELEFPHTTSDHVGWVRHGFMQGWLAGVILLDKSVLHSPLHDHLTDNLKWHARRLESGHEYSTKKLTSSQRQSYAVCMKEGAEALEKLYELAEDHKIFDWKGTLSKLSNSTVIDKF